MTKRTPLYEAHLRHGGKIVEFGGFELPIQYGTGLIAEHNAVRNNAGLFDVSHMGEFELTGPTAFDTVQNLVTNDITGMMPGQCRYTLMLNDNGGIVDDFIIYKFADDRYWLVVNAGNTEKDERWVMSHLKEGTQFNNRSAEFGQLAIQGPKSEMIMKKLISAEQIPVENYTFTETEIIGINCVLSRTGYTGEDGFEIYCPANRTEELFEKLLEVGKEDGLIPCALGARDTLRFEAAMPLYGHELAEDYLASEVGLNMFIKMDKDFIGKKALEQNPPKYRRKGVKIIDRGIAREGSEVYSTDGTKIGIVTTGTHSPTLGYAIAMVRIDKDYKGEEMEIDVRGKRLKAQTVKMPFYKRSY